MSEMLESDTGQEQQVLGTVITVEEIQQKIKELSTIESGESLKSAMGELKLALRHNPEASNLLLPEEIGELVRHLRKVTATEIVQADGADKNKAIKKAMKKVDFSDAEFMQQALKDF